MSEPNSDQRQADATSATRAWVKHATTLILLLAVIVTGTLAYFSRQIWWDMYMSLTH